MSETLQYGALGLLAAVLAAIGLWLRDYLKRRDDREDKASEYLKRLVDEDREDRKAREAIWQQLLEEDIKAKIQLTQTLLDISKWQVQLSKELAKAETRATERNQALLACLAPASEGRE